MNMLDVNHTKINDLDLFIFLTSKFIQENWIRGSIVEANRKKIS